MYLLDNSVQLLRLAWPGVGWGLRCEVMFFVFPSAKDRSLMLAFSDIVSLPLGEEL